LLAPGPNYFCRARAEDGANSGPYTGPAGFEVFMPIVIDPPALIAPAANSTVASLRPRFTIANARRTGPAGPISYLIEIATNGDAFTGKVATWSSPEQSNQTALDPPGDLASDKVYYWHVRAFDQTTLGPWSTTSAFGTPRAP